MHKSDSKKYIFISYIRDDKTLIDRISTFLDYHEVPYWLDRKHLIPGQDWKISIQQAIEEGALFISFFSNNYLGRDSSYMNEELLIAIESLRKRPQDTSWFIPARLDNCDIPKIKIGGGRYISDIQSLDFFEDFESALSRLLDVIKANNIPYNHKKSEPSLFSDLELKYLSLKSLIDNGTGNYFHNQDMGHPVYLAGALGTGSEPWEYADKPEQNELYKNLKDTSNKLKKSGYNVEQFTWWYDFDAWQSFCKYVVNTYRKVRGYEEL